MSSLIHRKVFGPKSTYLKLDNMFKVKIKIIDIDVIFLYTVYIYFRVFIRITN